MSTDLPAGAARPVLPSRVRTPDDLRVVRLALLARREEIERCAAEFPRLFGPQTRWYRRKQADIAKLADTLTRMAVLLGLEPADDPATVQEGPVR